jgi:hypothetical protein
MKCAISGPVMASLALLGLLGAACASAASDPSVTGDDKNLTSEAPAFYGTWAKPKEHFSVDDDENLIIGQLTLHASSRFEAGGVVGAHTKGNVAGTFVLRKTAETDFGIGGGRFEHELVLTFSGESRTLRARVNDIPPRCDSDECGPAVHNLQIVAADGHGLQNLDFME